MSEKSKELMEHLASVIKDMPEAAAVDALSHATARAEGIQTGLNMAKAMEAAEADTEEQAE